MPHIFSNIDPKIGDTNFYVQITLVQATFWIVAVDDQQAVH